MKKSIILFLLAAMTLSACSVYTCPTYAKKEAAPKKTSTGTRI